MTFSRSLPTGRPGRLLAAGLTVLAVAIVALGIVGPALERYAGDSETLARQRAILERMETITAQLPQWRERARDVARSVSNASDFLPGDSDPLAAAAAQATLQATLAELGASIASIEALPAGDLDLHRRIQLRLSFTASWPVLVDFLHRLDTKTPLLVESLQLSPARHRIGFVAGTFNVNCIVVGFRISAEKSSPP